MQFADRGALVRRAGVAVVGDHRSPGHYDRDRQIRRAVRTSLQGAGISRCPAILGARFQTCACSAVRLAISGIGAGPEPCAVIEQRRCEEMSWICSDRRFRRGGATLSFQTRRGRRIPRTRLPRHVADRAWHIGCRRCFHSAQRDAGLYSAQCHARLFPGGNALRFKTGRSRGVPRTCLSCHIADRTRCVGLRLPRWLHPAQRYGRRRDSRRVANQANRVEPLAGAPMHTDRDLADRAALRSDSMA